MSQEEPQRSARHQSYRTVGVVVVALGLAAVPALSLLGYQRLAVLWLAVGLLALALVRLQRPDGSWIAARGRVFDVVFGVGLALLILLLSPNVDLPRLM
ncbi:DUF3017 domain-containing protein [Actinomyces capricornis]|uniref:DUF3017 domain-containing protein n=1 Tax=Actinomyces capricornis TaxID=2755559 RepID=A0ABM7U7S8_9ACTO|nr:DUF3017 domain-containing protein [Actinomyces capricornis]BDA63514.1 hypothetical protein MANAM107_03480 [Actinomyces capricornis]